MYAVIKTGGKQYRVQAGDVIVVDKLAGEPGAKVAFNDVLMIGEGEAVTVGAPRIDGASVGATLIETRKGDKIKVFKKIRRQGYRRTRGHRQQETVLRVIEINGDGKSDAWTGEVDLTPRSELRLRARNLARTVSEARAHADAKAAFEHESEQEKAAVKAASKPAAKAKAPAKAKAEAKPAAKAPTKSKAPAKAKPDTKATAKASAPKPAKTVTKSAAAPRKPGPRGR